MITYNHEKYIRAALESVFNNKMLPDLVVLYDDCSMDETWDIVQEFKLKYQSILRCIRNKENIGIYKNMGRLFEGMKNCSCDIVSILSGDDYFYPEFFEEMNNVINKNDVSLSNEFIIITNSSRLYKNGKPEMVDNYKFRDKNVVKMRIRGKIDYRSVGFSGPLVKKIDFSVHEELGLWADFLPLFDLEVKCKQFYFSDFLATCYRCGVGITSREKILEIKRSKYLVNEEIKKRYREILDSRDINYLTLENKSYFLYEKYNLKNWLIFFLYYMKNIFNGEIYGEYMLLVPPPLRKFIRIIKSLI
jgi:glycosyltransferase involved in cell wall biosynthesis